MDLVVPWLTPRRAIDQLESTSGALTGFVLPGGVPAASFLHVARTVCRRAERRLVSLAATTAVGDWTLRYLNRLSDALFVMARYENRERGVEEPLWDSRA